MLVNEHGEDLTHIWALLRNLSCWYNVMHDALGDSG